MNYPIKIKSIKKIYSKYKYIVYLLNQTRFIIGFCLFKGGCPIGQLTTVGSEQMFNLGRRIREKYINEMGFLSSKYDPNEL
jgi:hypothetical protein